MCFACPRAILLCLLSASLAAAAPPDFVDDIAPLLREHCVKCHGPEKQKGGLRFDVKSEAVKKGDSGEHSIVPGMAGESELIRRVTSTDKDLRMPSEGEPLTAEQTELLKAWIDAGASWPDDGQPIAKGELVVTDEDRHHWSFRPLSSPQLPEIALNSEIDKFVVQSLNKAGLNLSRPASARTLVRRIHFDLIGLPPSREEIAAFEAAYDQDQFAAVAALIDRLLATRHYGERWGRHWLDVARYADSDGQEGDADRPFAWQYRDFVIKALNDDLPFDEFVRWQIAGDELEPDNPLAVAATGFWVAGPHTVLNVPMEDEKIRNRYNELDDMLSTFGSGMLGLSLACTRCHDHKYDAIPTRDYYRLLSAIHTGQRAEVDLAGSKALVFREETTEPKPTWLFHRADYYDKSEPVQLGFLTLFSAKTPAEYWSEAKASRQVEQSTYQRAALARWICDVEHGAGALLARVIVNRVWQHHFGEGLVRTPSDFGVQGEKPSHPELLEWLTHDFVANGWRLKRLHRQIMLSTVYQQGTAFDPEKAKIDPDNRLLWRRRPLRLEAEVLRDAMLASAGTLNLEPYGPAFKPPIAAEAMVARNLKTPYTPEPADSPNIRRRSVYMFHKRVVPNPLLATFDRPDATQSCSRRDATTVAPQALAILNDPFVRERAVEFADRLQKETGNDLDDTVRTAVAIALARSPSETELKSSSEFIAARSSQRHQRGLSEADAQRAALADFCQTLFGLNEFLYVD